LTPYQPDVVRLQRSPILRDSGAMQTLAVILFLPMYLNKSDLRMSITADLRSSTDRFGFLALDLRISGSRLN
jgi:hypothetical protein